MSNQNWSAPAGYVEDTSGRNNGWWYDPAGDPQNTANWVQSPPDGYVPDTNDQGWWYNPDPTIDINDLAKNWWHETTVSDAPGVTVPQAAGLVPGIDVSNAQPQDLAGLIALSGARHVIVKAYQSAEIASGRPHAKAQIQSARDNGCTVGLYVWLYASVNVQQQVDDTLSLAAEMGLVLPFYMIDVEPYTDGTCPTPVQVAAALNAFAVAGQRGALYTGKWVWDRLGNPGGFEGTPLWIASYNHQPTFELPSFGGMQIIGHQYDDVAGNGQGLDMDVFDPSAV